MYVYVCLPGYGTLGGEYGYFLSEIDQCLPPVAPPLSHTKVT